MKGDWQGTVIPPYEPSTLPLISGITGELTGNHRPKVIGAYHTIWNGTRAPSYITGPMCTSREAALAEAERWIHEHTEGMLDPAMFAMSSSHDSSTTTTGERP